MVTLPASVLALGNLAREGSVVQGMIFGVNGQVIVLGIEGQSFGQRPRYQDAVALKTKVPVQGSGVVLLNDEGPLGRRRSPFDVLLRAHGLGGFLRIALGPILRELGVAPRIRAFHGDPPSWS